MREVQSLEKQDASTNNPPTEAAAKEHSQSATESPLTDLDFSFDRALAEQQTTSVNQETQHNQIPGVPSNGSSFKVDSWSSSVVLLLSVLGTISAIRGTAKAIEYFRKKFGAKRRFDKREWFDSISFNVHKVVERDGKLQLDAWSVGNMVLSDMIPNSYAEKRFIAAARNCELRTPVISTHFPNSKKNNRISGMNRMNRYIRDAFSALFRDGAMARSLGLPVKKDKYILIPLCERNPYNRKKGKFVSIAALSLQDFKRLGEKKELIAGADREMSMRLRNLRHAYKAIMNFSRKHSKEGPLFPRATVYMRAS